MNEIASDHDTACWLTRTLDERLTEVERLRRLSYGYDDSLRMDKSKIEIYRMTSAECIFSNFRGIDERGKTNTDQIADPPDVDPN